MNKVVKRFSIVMLNGLIQRVQSVCTMLAGYDKELVEIESSNQCTGTDEASSLNEAIIQIRASINCGKKAAEALIKIRELKQQKGGRV